MYSDREERTAALLNSDAQCDLELMEGVKLLMLLKAIDLHKDMSQGNEVPIFVWLMFARDTSETIELFVKNHLNPVGDIAGLEQVTIIYRALDKREFLVIIRDNFSYFSLKPYLVTPHLNRLIETVQMEVTTYVFMQN